MKFFVTLLGVLAGAMLAGAEIDTVTFGDAASEQAHAFSGSGSKAEKGGLGESCRRLLPLSPVSWKGGTMKFRAKVDPEKANYVTVKFWGQDVNENLLLLSVDGKQLGYRHLGDYDILDHGSSAPALFGRFFYTTTPLPLAATSGKREVELEIAANGRIWGYGRNFEQYQKEMIAPSRGIYRLYTHTDGYFTPPAGEKFGKAPAPVKPEDPAGTFDRLKARVGREIDNWLKPNNVPSNQMQIEMLAQAYRVKWTKACRNPETVKKVAAGIDGYFRRWRKDPKLASYDRATYNADWFGFGPLGDAILQMPDELKPLLDESIDDGEGGRIVRRKAWADLLEAGVAHLSTHRRQYTNQSMIIDMNLHRNNRALHWLDQSRGIPLEQTLGFLLESTGIKPWSGSLDKQGKPTWPLGRDYMELTAKHLTRELGFVGNYGEILDWASSIYDATRPAPGEPGNEEIRDALAGMICARSYFRYPSLDADGRPAMRLETVVGWRDTAYPGDVVYAQRPNRDGSAIQAVAATLDPYAIGLAQQMFDDKQFFRSVEHQMKEGGFRVTFGLLHTPDQYELLQKQPKQPSRMPMSAGEPDFVFSDEENGVLAVKDGDEILYASLYWRARHAVNSLAKFHHITPELERIATVREEINFEPSGLFYLRPDWTNFGFGNGGVRYPDKTESLHRGEKLPIAKIPAGIDFKPGQENSYAGRGEFYRCGYGPFEIGMNASKTKRFSMTLPPGEFRRLGNGGGTVQGKSTVSVPPMSTFVYRKILK